MGASREEEHNESNQQLGDGRPTTWAAQGPPRRPDPGIHVRPQEQLVPEPAPEPAHRVRLAEVAKERGPVLGIVDPQHGHGEQAEEGVEAVEEDEGAPGPPDCRDAAQGCLAEGDGCAAATRVGEEQAPDVDLLGGVKLRQLHGHEEAGEHERCNSFGGDVTDEQLADLGEREAAPRGWRFGWGEAGDLAWRVDEAGVVPVRET